MNIRIWQKVKLVFLISIVIISHNRLYADGKIQISANPALPVKNILKNPSFEEQNSSWSQYASSFIDRKYHELKPNIELNKIIGKESHSGNFCYRLTGEEGVNNGITQKNIKIDPPIPAGTPIYMSGWLKSKGSIVDGGAFGLSIRIMYVDNKVVYISPPCFSKGEHPEWTKATSIFIPKKDVKMIHTVSCFYNNQEGVVYFDDIFLAIGKTELTYKVSGTDIKNIKLYGEEEGLIEDSNILSRGIDSYTKTVKVGILGEYCVEVEDYAGNTYREIYPKTKKQAETKGIISLSRMQKEIIKSGKEDIYNVNLPDDIVNKKVILEFRARLHHTPRIYGYCAGLKILLNNTELQMDRLMNRKKTFTLARGSIGNTYYSGGFATYYSPDFACISEDNSFCPVDIPRCDPYSFKFDVSGLVKKGKNIITVRHNVSKVKDPLIINNMRLTF